MKYVFLFSCLLLSLTSCSSDDNPIQINGPKTLNGSWTMVNIFGGFAGIDDDYEPGQIIWTFDEENQSLTVNNSIEDDETVFTSGFDSGTYPYHTETEEEADYLYVDGYNFGAYYFDSDKLLVDQGVGSDGFRFTLKKYSGN